MKLLRRGCERAYHSRKKTILTKEMSQSITPLQIGKARKTRSRPPPSAWIDKSTLFRRRIKGTSKPAASRVPQDKTFEIPESFLTGNSEVCSKIALQDEVYAANRLQNSTEEPTDTDIDFHSDLKK